MLIAGSSCCKPNAAGTANGRLTLSTWAGRATRATALKDYASCCCKTVAYQRQPMLTMIPLRYLSLRPFDPDPYSRESFCRCSRRCCQFSQRLGHGFAVLGGPAAAAAVPHGEAVQRGWHAPVRYRREHARLDGVRRLRLDPLRRRPSGHRAASGLFGIGRGRTAMHDSTLPW